MTHVSDQAIDTDLIAARIRAATPMVREVDLRRAGDGWRAFLTLDPSMVRARAGQQGLADRSVAGAAASPRLQEALARSIETVNDGLPADQQIVRHEIIRTEQEAPAILSVWYRDPVRVPR